MLCDIAGLRHRPVAVGGRAASDLAEENALWRNGYPAIASDGGLASLRDLDELLAQPGMCWIGRLVIVPLHAQA
jgi:hypothetical protein